MLIGGFPAGRLLGFRIRIDYSWFIVLALVTWTFAKWQFPSDLPRLSGSTYLAMGLAGALLLFLSVVLHELAHSVVARSRGIEVAGITLFIFGGVAEMRQEPKRPADEFLLTIVGPLSSLLLSFLFLVAARLLAGWGAGPPAVVADTLATLNLVLAVFNMVPAFPLDGGRVLRAILWRVTGDPGLATRWATWIGRGFGWLLIAYGFFLFMSGVRLAGLWGMLLGWFLTSAATSAARQDALRRALRGVPVGQVLHGPPVYVDGEHSVEELVESYILRLPVTAFPVVSGERVIGVVTVSDVSGLSLDERPVTRVRQIMVPLEKTLMVEADRPLVEVCLGLRAGTRDRFLVLRQDRIVGALSSDDLASWIERAREVGVRPAGSSREEEGQP
ncbi:MAG TPA: site-2 protease family protein [Longimicrobiales bacterium]|nr:site-2 protease family protein [Longimicrobiales bacterium]